MLQLVQAKENLWHGKFAIFPDEQVTAVVSTRFGGVSRAGFASLNLALHVQDNANAVLENRRRFARSLGVKPSDFVTVRQVHGARVLHVNEKERGLGALVYDEHVPEADAMITNVPQLPLMIFVADCVPILFYDPQHQAIGLAHAGWKGTAKCIAQKTVQAMQETFGTRPEDLRAAFGPSIGPCCFDVHEDVAAVFRKNFPTCSQAVHIDPENKSLQVDLWAVNRWQLEECGLLSRNIESAEVCTVCHHEVFFSYRASQGKAGRLGICMMLRSKGEA